MGKKTEAKLEKHWFRYVIKGLWTALIIGLLIYFISQKKLTVGATAGFLLLLALVWYFNPKDVGNMVIDLRSGKLEVNKIKDETVAAARQVSVTAERFDQVTNAFANFSGEVLQTQGRLGMSVPWRSGADFVLSVRKMRRLSENAGSPYSYSRSIRKVYDLFAEDMMTQFPELSDEINRLVQTGEYLENGELHYTDRKPIVGLKQMEALESKLPSEKHLNWNQEIADFKEFYEQVKEDA